MRKLISLLTALVIAVAAAGTLSSCGKKGDLEPPPAADDEKKKKKT